MGHGYKGGTSYYHSITDNLDSLSADYKYNNGYFGDKGKGRSFVRNIYSENLQSTAKDFYDKASHGGIEKDLSNGKGVYTKMADGTILSYREVSSSDGSPVVEINIKASDKHGNLNYQKIHFVKGD